MLGGWLVCRAELSMLQRASTLARAALVAKAGPSDPGQDLVFAYKPELLICLQAPKR